MRNVFGWSLPPGCTQKMIDDQIQGNCEVCRENVDNCCCPECPVCGAIGDPKCYEEHGLMLNEEI